MREGQILQSYAELLTNACPSPLALTTARAALRGEDAAEEKGKGDDQADQKEMLQLRAELEQVETWMSTAYEDRLVGRIDSEFFDRHVKEWRLRIDHLRVRLAEVEAAARSARTKCDVALELSQLSKIFIETKEPSRRRRLLEILHSNSTWKGGVLSVEWSNVSEYN